MMVYDGTWEGLLSAVFDAYALSGAVIVSSKNTQPSMFGACAVKTDEEKARRLIKGMSRLNADMPAFVYRGFLAEWDGYEDALLASLRLGFDMGADPFTQRQHPFVHRVCAAERRAGGEAHRIMGLARFAEVRTGRGVIYAGDIAPDCNVLPLIGGHFHGRFTDQRMILRDVRRRTALVSDPDSWWITELGGAELETLPDAGGYEAMWRGYFKAMAQKERANHKLQRRFVPLKYRRHLPEFFD
ncbi:MAG: TIGR03915 family putative DNA repair protein [Oscillospiraceae bacterium]|nr:TIGR03915 family putative DNA repair protein [Oscillospiraceae bacterium]